MSTEAHGGVCQHRDRIYIVGIRCDTQVKDFTWPEKSPCCMSLAILGPAEPIKKDLSTLQLDQNGKKLSPTVRKNLAAFQNKVAATNQLNEDWIVNCGNSKVHFMKGVSPCLTESRCKGLHGYWSQKHQRFLDHKDFFLLQGIPPNSYVFDPAKHSSQTLGQLAGNAMKRLRGEAHCEKNFGCQRHLRLAI